MGETKPPAMDGDPTLTPTFMEEPELLLHLGALAATFGEPSLRKNDEGFRRPFDMEGRALKILGDLVPVQSRAVWESAALSSQELWNVKGRGPIKLMLRDLLPHVWEELRDLERWFRSIDGCSSLAKYQYHILGTFLPLIMRDWWLGDLFGVSPNMSANECRKVIGAGKCPKEMGVAQVFKEVLRPDSLPFVWECLVNTLSVDLFKARSKAEEELEASLERRYAKGAAEGERCFFYELQEIEWRANRAIALEAKAVDAANVIHQDLYTAQLEWERLKEDMAELLFDLVAARTERDKVDNGVEAAREEASGLLAKLASARSEVEALYARDFDSYINGVKSHVEHEVAKGEVSLLRGQVVLFQGRQSCSLGPRPHRRRWRYFGWSLRHRWLRWHVFGLCRLRGATLSPRGRSLPILGPWLLRSDVHR
ncbi:hypothetical protein ACLOJK_003242 [Asimina triloba]